MGPSSAASEAGSNGSSSYGPIGEALRNAKPDEERLPRRFGEYVLLSRLGEGGFGAVYLAYEEGLHREVATNTARAFRTEQDDPRLTGLVEQAEGQCYTITKAGRRALFELLTTAST